ncbi:hypothetical protein C2845_PM01G14430 [Panicum miliaceum]|uniref:Glutathione peroxidase n=1 Tax=Panicum miliaceum TaxID=4540 RepID=A0A3L6TPT9_PANMI|nr:hypothetical protein C2845_PM01G14430 [Panicum miliaceum]
MAAATSVHDFAVKDASGKDVPLSTYKGKVLLIVNVASRCGQEPGTNEEIVQFVCTRFKAKYPIFDKVLNLIPPKVNFVIPPKYHKNSQETMIKFYLHFSCMVDVNGEDAAPIYKVLKSSKTGPFGDNIKWNFAKFLVDKQGRVAERYAPTTYPLSIQKDIKNLLGSF